MTQMPYGYRWLTQNDIDYRSELAHETIRDLDGKKIIAWDCMVEFGMDHDHDAEECERMIAGMSGDYHFDPMDDIPWGTPDSWIPDNPNEDGFCQSDFI